MAVLPYLSNPPYLQITFKVVDPSGGALVPEQALVRLTSSASGREAHFAAVETAAGALAAKVTYADLENLMGSPSESFEMSIIIGNTRPAVAEERPVSELVLYRPGADAVQAPPAVKVGLTALAQKKPEIVHTHRAPEKRTPGIISVAFAGGAFAPLAAFLLLAAHFWTASKVRYLLIREVK